MFVNVIIDIGNKSVDVIYTYKIDQLPTIFAKLDDIVGYRVIVPFGRGNNNREGFVVSTSITSTYDEDKIKSVVSFPDYAPIFSREQIMLANWIKEKYFSTTFSALKLMKPIGAKMSIDSVFSVIDLDKKIKLTDKDTKIIDYIKKYNIVSEKELKEEFGGNIKVTLKKLINKEILSCQQISKVQDMTLRIKQVFINYDNLKIDDLLTKIKDVDSKQRDVIFLLEEYEKLPMSDIMEILKISASPIETLAKKNIVTIKKEEIRRNSIFNFKSKLIKTTKLKLNDEQQKALETIENHLINKDKKTILLHGVTGSGKTEVYLQAIEKILMENKQAIVLVPEISLTPQIVNIFLGRFGDKISVTHSRLSIGERYDQWKKARDGEISIMIGPRSAIFTPFTNLVIVIIDEEHEGTYKSDTTPKYNTIEVAEELCKINNATLILGSATPKLESYTKALDGDYTLVKMKNRINNQFPETIINDMRNELVSGNRSIFSLKLQELMVETLNNDKQIILFLNRRGFSNFVSCRDCGYVVTCDICNVNYTYHKYNNKLVCHYCNAEIENPTNCPICGSLHIRHFGVGTQRIEEEVKKLFPKENVLRMDFDTTSKKNSHEKILDEFKNNKSRILIGTQMIAKGLDFPNVTLVGIIAADLSLHAGDFRGAENTFQLITQVAGRAGRSKDLGKVVIQTYNSEHYAIQHAKNNDYESFYNDEIALRRQMDYPPFTNIFTIIFTSIDEKRIIIMLNKLIEIMNFYNKRSFFTMIGPSQCVISKVKNKYRWKVIVKGKDYDLLIQFCLFTLDKLKKIDTISDIDINININPNVIM